MSDAMLVGRTPWWYVALVTVGLAFTYGILAECFTTLARARGRALVAWTELPERDLFERVAWMLARRLAQRLARIGALLREERRAPSFWARDLDRLADVVRERVEEPERAIPFELTARHDRTAARAVAVRRVREYGEILIHWPALWEAARALRARGDHPREVP